MSIKSTVVGAGLGLVAGSALGMVRAATVLCPVVWIPGSAMSGACLAHSASDGNPLATVACGVAGAVYGTGCVVAYPVSAALVVGEAMCLPVVGTVVGGVVGSNK